jgi:excinuclease ABC subunit B
LIQTIGRAARNANSKVILYADKVTNSMKMAIDETERRRAIQQKYNEEHGITPETIIKSIRSGIEADASKHRKASAAAKGEADGTYITIEFVDALEQEMIAAAEALEFERAASLRDRVLQLKENIGKPLAEVEYDAPEKSARGGRQSKRRKGVKGGRSKVPRPKAN